MKFRIELKPWHSDVLILCVRICMAVFMLYHGWPKFMRFFSGEELKFSDPIGIGKVPSLVLIVFAEVFCSISLAFGFLTRFALIPLMISMAVAAFIAHSGDSFSDREASLIYLVTYVLLFVSGPGKYSIDQTFLTGKKS